jgi:formylglycine-generating enzyme required for sulfatase activity
MAGIAGTWFVMGSEAVPGTEADERPRHRVRLESYCLDRDEVTAQDYDECVGKGLCSVRGAAPGCSGPAERQHPANCVDWRQARDYCAQRGRRLPTEAEWEFAATRGASAYPWGSARPDPARLNMAGGDDGWTGTAPVGSFPRGATADGLRDLAGNVAEWVRDPYLPYPADDVEGPRADPGGDVRVLRGGGFNDAPSEFRGANRGFAEQTTRTAAIGFRCAADPRRR